MKGLLLNNFYLNFHTSKFYKQTQKLEPPNVQHDKRHQGKVLFNS